MLRSVEFRILPSQAPKVLFRMPLFLVLYVPPALSRKAQTDDASLPKYDLHIKTKTVIKGGRPASCLSVPQTTS